MEPALDRPAKLARAGGGGSEPLAGEFPLRRQRAPPERGTASDAARRAVQRRSGRRRPVASRTVTFWKTAYFARCAAAAATASRGQKEEEAVGFGDEPSEVEELALRREARGRARLPGREPPDVLGQLSLEEGLAIAGPRPRSRPSGRGARAPLRAAE